MYESLERTAAREVQEETGLVVRLVLPIGQIHYSFRLAGVPYDKTVDFYLMQPMGATSVSTMTNTSMCLGFRSTRPCGKWRIPMRLSSSSAPSALQRLARSLEMQP